LLFIYLFDLGAKASFTTKELAIQENLLKKPCSIAIAGFGSDKSASTHGKTSFKICTSNGIKMIDVLVGNLVAYLAPPDKHLVTVVTQ
jgi:hypothetical protein